MVFDAGVWFSAIQFGGVPLAAIKRGFVQGSIACSSEIRAETEHNLAHKRYWNPSDVRSFMDQYLRGAPDTPIAGHIKGMCRDANDDHVLECAVNSKARFLVSGDKDLLVLSGMFRFTIVTPREYLGLEDTTAHKQSRN